MPTAGQTTAQAIQVVRSRLGLTGKYVSDWTYAERIAYNQALAEELLKNPSSISQNQRVTASRILSRGYQPLEDTGFDVGLFVQELGNQAVSLNDTLNPLSEGNRDGLATAIKWLAIAAVVTAGLVYFAPFIAPKIKQAIAAQ